jgi:hypothetical protein
LDKGTIGSIQRIRKFKEDFCNSDIASDFIPLPRKGMGIHKIHSIPLSIKHRITKWKFFFALVDGQAI